MALSFSNSIYALCVRFASAPLLGLLIRLLSWRRPIDPLGHWWALLIDTSELADAQAPNVYQRGGERVVTQHRRLM